MGFLKRIRSYRIIQVVQKQSRKRNRAVSPEIIRPRHQRQLTLKSCIGKLSSAIMLKGSILESTRPGRAVKEDAATGAGV